MKEADLRELALKKVKITGNVIGKFGAFEIEQTYLNNTKDVLEVGYTFPIVETATVVGFEIHVGDKVLKGVCKEKGEAKKEYTQNLVKGNSSYLMEQETDNTFKISVGKIDKNEEVTVKINYIDKFEIVDNTIRIMMPTLVTPRYKSEVTEKLEYGKVDYTVDFEINIDKKLKRKRISCLSHEINLIDEKNVEKVTVLDYDMSKDFKLEIELKKELTSTAISQKTKDEKELVYLSFMPEIEETYGDSKKEYIFIVDTSGSMMGDKMLQTKDAVIGCLKQLEEGDKYNIVDFNSSYKVMNIDSIVYNEKSLQDGINFVEEMHASGGTEILKPIKFALDGKSENKVVLLFTDGQVGNESEILEYVCNNIQSARLFAFGIDTNVNASFIKGLAKNGHGKAELIMPNQKIDESIIRTFARIQTPMVENITIDYGKAKLDDEIKEDNVLFNYEFFNVFALLDEVKSDITLKGTILGKEHSWVIKKEDITKPNVDLEVLFAKEQILRLDEYIQHSRDAEKNEEYKKMIIELATKYNINSKYTAFITVLERDQKLHDVPKYQETTLSSGFLKGVFDFFGGNQMAQPSMAVPMTGAVRKEKSARMGGARGFAKMAMNDTAVDGGAILMDMECTEEGMRDGAGEAKTPTMELKEMLNSYCDKFNFDNPTSLKTALLLILFKLTYEGISGIGEEKVLSFIRKNAKEITEDSLLKLIAIKIVRNLILQIDEVKVKEAFGEYYSEKFTMDFSVDLMGKIDTLYTEDIQKVVDNNDFDGKVDNALMVFLK